MRGVLAAVLMLAGIAAAGYAGYLQYAAIPGEHTVVHRGARLALVLGGFALLVAGSQVLP